VCRVERGVDVGGGRECVVERSAAVFCVCDLVNGGVSIARRGR